MEEFREMARVDQARYDREIAAFGDKPFCLPVEKEAKDPSAPKRPPSSYVLYYSAHRRLLASRYPTAPGTALTATLRDLWHSEHHCVKDFYTKVHKEREQQYKLEQDKWLEN